MPLFDPYFGRVHYVIAKAALSDSKHLEIHMMR